MKIQKRHWFIIFSILVLLVSIEVYQYTQTLKEEFASAVTIGTPNPGHSWSEMECSSDTLCIDTANKRLGIGTNNPATALDVVGDINTSKGIRLNTAGGDSQPNCSSGTRGTMWAVSSVSGASDSVYVCLKNSNNTYSWAIIGQGTFVCGTSVSFTYNGSTVTYGTILSPAGKCFMDRNLGAAQVATAYNDSAAYGDLFQWGRLVDGHQIRTSGITTARSSTDVPGHSNFIYGNSSDWRSPRNNLLWLWQEADTINNPCPTGWRVPTSTEWQAEVTAGLTNYTTAYNNLKLTAAGFRHYAASGTIYNTGVIGEYWSSTFSSDPNAYLFDFRETTSTVTYASRSYGYSVRCIKN